MLSETWGPLLFPRDQAKEPPTFPYAIGSAGGCNIARDPKGALAFILHF